MSYRRQGRFSVWLLMAGLSWAGASARAQQAKVFGEVLRGIGDGQFQVVDLTHPLDDQSPYWPEGASGTPFHASVVATFQKEGYFARQFSLPEHFGTHMDAPVHFDPRGPTVDRIPVQRLVAPAAVVDVSEEVKSNPDYRVSAADLERWVKAHGPFPQGAIVFIRTGWAERWPSEKRYMNQDAKGGLHFPGLSVGAARYLLDRAHPVAVGIDTGSIDYGPSKNFEVHHLTLSAGLYHLENVANLGRLPATGALVIALPLKLRGGSGAPARVIALVPSPSAPR